MRRGAWNLKRDLFHINWEAVLSRNAKRLSLRHGGCEEAQQESEGHELEHTSPRYCLQAF